MIARADAGHLSRAAWGDVRDDDSVNRRVHEDAQTRTSAGHHAALNHAALNSALDSSGCVTRSTRAEGLTVSLTTVRLSAIGLTSSQSHNLAVAKNANLVRVTLQVLVKLVDLYRAAAGVEDLIAWAEAVLLERLRQVALQAIVARLERAAEVVAYRAQPALARAGLDSRAAVDTGIDAGRVRSGVDAGPQASAKARASRLTAEGPLSTQLRAGLRTGCPGTESACTQCAGLSAKGGTGLSTAGHLGTAGHLIAARRLVDSTGNCTAQIELRVSRTGEHSAPKSC